jgi:hypothetical protein
MKVLGSPQRIRLAALVVSAVGILTFIAAQDLSGRLGIVFALVSLSLFFLEVALGVIDGLNRETGE